MNNTQQKTVTAALLLTGQMKRIAVSVIHTLLFCAVLISTVAHAANITVTISRNPVAVDDSFHLIYEADSSVDDDPDFTPIYQHFDVLSSSQSTNMRSINGNWRLKKTWDLAVIAKDIGKLTIPAINFGSDISPAIQVTITNSSSPNSVAPDGQSTIPAKIFLESSIDKKSGWVQSQFIYTIRLLRTVNITGASLTEPETSDPDAIIHQIGEDQYQTTRNGIRHEVIERRYAIFPQKSGLLKINPVTFEGRINVTQPRSIFDQFRMSGQLKRLRSKAVTANVKAAPPGINLQDWLPAGNLQLIEEWSDDIENIKAGEPVTRTMTIVAEGLTGLQLPELDIKEVDGLKQYPDKAVVENRQSKNGLTGIKQIKVALIPAAAGNYTLPEIKLQWWNTKTNKKEIATIAQTILTATGEIQTNKVITHPVQTQNESIQDKQLTIDNKVPPSSAQTELDEAYWKWLALFFALAWLVTLILFFKKSKRLQTQNKIKTNTSTTSLKSAISAVKKQAKNNETNGTKIALIKWAQLFYDDKELTNLSQITEHCSAQLSQHIRQLNQTLYSPEKTTWNGKELAIAFKDEQLLNNKQKNKHHSALKALYNK